jgi:retinol dehydrogenase 12
MNRTYLITGANTGIGRVTAEVLAKRGERVFLACRSADRTQPVVDGIKAAGGFAEFLPLDLGDLASVRACAAGFLERGEPLHGLINNAGLAGQRGQTKQGFELAFGTNHLGHFLLTTMLLPRLREAGGARIVNVASKSHYQAKGIDFEACRRPTATVPGLAEYSVSKLANVLFTKELSRRLGGEVHSYSLHPGVIASDVWRSVPWGLRHLMKAFMKSNEDGALTTLYCATDEAVKDHDGRYYDDCRERKPSKLADDPALAAELWERSERWCEGALGLVRRADRPVWVWGGAAGNERGAAPAPRRGHCPLHPQRGLCPLPPQRGLCPLHPQRGLCPMWCGGGAAPCTPGGALPLHPGQEKRG